MATRSINDHLRATSFDRNRSAAPGRKEPFRPSITAAEQMNLFVNTCL